MTILNRMLAEFIGSFWLVFAGCGAAVIAAAYPYLGIGFVGVSLAFGLALLTAAYALANISGCHINPAVTVGLWAGRRFPARDVPAYVAAQLVGAIAGAAALLLIASGTPSYDLATHGLAANGYGEHSPGGYSLGAAFALEMIATFFFVFVIMGATRNASSPFAAVAPIGIGLALTLVHLFSIPVTNASVNPARSTGPALIQGGWALQQLWVFWAAPLTGAILGGLAYRVLTWKKSAPVPAAAQP
jgi:aquaporin Z